MNLMNIDIFIPARLDSKRLSKKHLRKINNIPIIIHLINRLKLAKKIRNIIVCTTNSKSDDPFIEILQKENIMFFRGSENDILQRMLDAAKKFETDIIIDVEGDDFYTDPTYVDKIAYEMENSELDFIAGNSSTKTFDNKRGFPHGLIPAGIRKNALEKICELKKTDNTETGYKEFFMVHDFFKKKYLIPENDLKIPENLRLTLDYPEDLKLVKEVFKELGNDFHFKDLLSLFEKNPSLLEIVRPIIQKWQNNYNNKKADFSLIKKTKNKSNI